MRWNRLFGATLVLCLVLSFCAKAQTKGDGTNEV